MPETMQAAWIPAPGTDGGCTLTERPIPVPGPGEAVVRLTAAALNHRDLYQLTGYQGKGWLPFIPGSDGAGTVAATGPGVHGWQAGDSVIMNATLGCGHCAQCGAGEQSLCDSFSILGGPGDGTLAEYVRVPAVNLLPCPPHLSLSEAAALPLALGTAWRAVVTRGGLVPGETVLIHGIGGGVALYALQIAIGMGCRAIVTSSNAEKLARAADLGAAAGINYTAEDVAARVLALTDGRGVDLVVDGTGRATLPIGMMAARRGGRIVHFGSHTGAETTLANRMIFWKQLSLIGTTMNSQRDLAAAIRFVNQRQLHPVISHRYPLAALDQAFATLDRGQQFGKIVVTLL